MTAITTLGVDNLSLRGAGTEYNLITRLFTTKAEADAALALGAASGGWVPTAGKTNVCITADEGILTYDFNTSALVNADSATRTYADTEIAAAVAALIDSAPGALDTLNELAAAINDVAGGRNVFRFGFRPLFRHGPPPPRADRSANRTAFVTAAIASTHEQRV